MSLTENRNSYTIIKNSLHQVENLNNTLRAQRHDFMNHLQVVHGLIDMEEFDEAKRYIQRVFEDIQKVNSFLKTSNPAVNALLQAKILTAEKFDIKVILNIKSTLKDITIPSWELCRVIGNLLDNAIYALKDQNLEKVIEVHIFEDLTSYGFKVKNNGPSIPADILNRIFEAGFTTKASEGQGMGLYICKDILSKFGGDIRVSCNDGFIEFDGSFKK
jgi:sensor histidine kinase regulating citrate/malate metabolism